MEEKLGVYICECGPNISEKVDIDKVITDISSIEGVDVVGRHKLLCSGDGKEFLVQRIKEEGITRLVIAACSPKQHESTFMEVCETAGINPYLFQLANIREQCAWIIEDKEEATSKAKRQIRAAIGRVQYHVPLYKQSIEVSPDVVIIGGGITGIEASLLLASPQRKVYLVEKRSSLGGAVGQFERIFPDMIPASSLLEKKIQSVVENENIEVLVEHEVEQVLGFFGSFEVKLRKVTDENEEVDIDVGAIIVAIGFRLFGPDKISRYGYGKYDDIYTSMEFEQMNSQGKISLKNGSPPKSVAIIHCVGREEKGYCSGVCCLYSIKFSRYLKEKIPGVRVVQFYKELSIPGQSYQKFYEETKEKEVDFIRVQDIEVIGKANAKAIKYKTLGGEEKTVDVDMIILSPAMESAADSSKLSAILNIAQDSNGFFAESHEKLGPVSTSIEGVFIAGCAQGPKSIPESIVQSNAAAGRILSSLVPGRKFEPEVKTSSISPVLCIGCKTCLTVCAYSAITFNERKGISEVNEVICQGCGNCAAACPSGAASMKHFTFRQIYQEVIEGVR